MTTMERLRYARGQSLREMARDLGVSHETVRQVEKGRTRLQPRTASRWATSATTWRCGPRSRTSSPTS
jgi:transcriptional regulator with XRE-family HTH domain